MAVKDKEKRIKSMISQVLGVNEATNNQFDWFVNKHCKDTFKERFERIHTIFVSLNGDPAALDKKRKRRLVCDLYLGDPYNRMLEFDEFQHFTSSRLLTLNQYSNDLELGFDIEYYRELCRKNRYAADKYRSNKRTSEFNFPGGRTAQRAYLDAFRDLLPTMYGLKPTIRISEFEVEEILEQNDYKGLEILLQKIL